MPQSDLPPHLAVTHAVFDHGTLRELGAVLHGRVVWRMSAQCVITLYRAGVRFFMTTSAGKAVEIYVDPGLLQDKPTLRTVGDRLLAPQLLTLPHFA